MKPPKFEYQAPSTVEEALALLERYGGEAKILAGGQSLMPVLAFRLATPAILVDINRIADLAFVRLVGDTLHIGAATRHRTIEHDATVREHLPLLAEAASWVAHLPIRTRGTIGGSLAHADPAAEFPMIAATLDATLVVRGPTGTRTIAAREFFVSYLTTALAQNEILTEIRFPVLSPRYGYAIEEFARRKGDFAIVSVATAIGREGNHCTFARIGAAGIGPTPLRLNAVEDIVLERGLSPDALAAASDAAAIAAQPLDDIHASADYRRHLTRVLVRRALTRAGAPRSIS